MIVSKSQTIAVLFPVADSELAVLGITKQVFGPSVLEQLREELDRDRIRSGLPRIDEIDWAAEFGEVDDVQ